MIGELKVQSSGR